MISLLYEKTILLLLVVLLICGCEKNIEQIINEDIVYSTYTNDDFTIQYPSWPSMGDNTEVEVSVTKGYCSVSINTVESDASGLYNYLLENSPNQVIVDTNEEELLMIAEMDYLDYHFVAENKIVGCNNQAHVISISCLEEIYNEDYKLYDEIYSSIVCNDGSSEGIVYISLDDEDFEVEYPDWDDLKDDAGEERVLGVSAGVCTVFVNKYSASPENIYEWIIKSLNENDDNDLLSYSKDNDIYYLEYTMPYENQELTAYVKLEYCNYLTYMTMVVCSNDFASDKHYEMKDLVLNSAQCTKYYPVPEPPKVEDVVDKNPEVEEELEDILDVVIDTNAGEEFGIDEEVVVYFVNNNLFFTKVLSEFDKSNLVFEDDDRNLEFKVDFDENGKIIYLGDGAYSDADVTLYVPLNDALNLINNAENINPLNLIALAVNVRTEPEHIKDEIIQKVLSGYYN